MIRCPVVGCKNTVDGSSFVTMNHWGRQFIVGVCKSCLESIEKSDDIMFIPRDRVLGSSRW